MLINHGMVASAVAREMPMTTLLVPAAPAVLPGTWFAQHDFFYASETRDRKMYVVKNGEIICP